MSDTSLQQSRVLVVGGAGFVGSNLCHALLAGQAAEVWIADNLLSSDLANVPEDPRVRLLLGSIADDKILGSLPRTLDYVFHLSCYHGNQSSIADPLADHANNTLTTLKLYETLKDFRGLKKVVYAAAGCAVAAKTADQPIATTEEAPPSLFQDSPYSISKLVGEMYGNYYFMRHGLPLVKARFQNVYGPREILGAGRWRGTPHTVWRNVIPTFVWKSLHHEALPLDNGGQVSRDFIYVDDIVRGLLACAALGRPSEAYNLASGVETSILELANTINAATGNPTPHDVRPPRDWDRSGRRFGSTEKSQQELNFTARVDLRTGIQQTVEWVRQNQPLILNAMRPHRRFVPEVITYLARPPDGA